MDLVDQTPPLITSISIPLISTQFLKLHCFSTFFPMFFRNFHLADHCPDDLHLTTHKQQIPTTFANYAGTTIQTITPATGDVMKQLPIQSPVALELLRHWNSSGRQPFRFPAATVPVPGCHRSDSRLPPFRFLEATIPIPGCHRSGSRLPPFRFGSGAGAPSIFCLFFFHFFFLFFLTFLFLLFIFAKKLF